MRPLSDKPYPFMSAMLPELFENVEDYEPGGLLPVKLGDILVPGDSESNIHTLRFRILGKMGYGAFSTVWLARDMTEGSVVAVKTARADSSLTSCEAAILDRLRSSDSDSDDSDASPVVQMLHAFTVQSPNGVHQVLIMEPVIPVKEIWPYLPFALGVKTRSLVRQLLEGLAFIHQRGVVHGDLHPSNIGVSIQDHALDRLSDMEIWRGCGHPTVVPVVSKDPARNPASIPTFLTANMEISSLLRKTLPDILACEPRVRIMDLGSARFADQAASSSWVTPLEFAAPELVFPKIAHKYLEAPLDRATDIWSLACTIWYFLGGPLFPSGENSILHQMACVCGDAPSEWTPFLQPEDMAKTRAAQATTPDLFWAEKNAALIERGHTLEDARAITALLRRMLRIDPLDRPAASQLLDFYLAELPSAPLFSGPLFLPLMQPSTM
ncbi:Dis1-suppressing protein kinase dsk1 [Mycena chlorophos]|uniref:Dis1-suppressing protein kinase dsk1 n=1 Tax=Mycena chlorophos TaxID=658473 RepID=A0A8H6TNR0_MYCCL|nr:Dis1-suppressing protein kinase dsk1 [Mycena chlorophos]